MFGHELFDFTNETFIERVGAAYRQRQTVTDKIEALGHRAKLFGVFSADGDPVFRRDFVKVDRFGWGFDNLA